MKSYRLCRVLTRRIACFSVIATIPVLTWADGNQLEPDKPCHNIEIFSKQIMMARQEGVPLTDMMDIAGDNYELKRITMEAYDAPRITSPDMLRQLVQDFSNDQVLECYKLLSR